MISALSATIMYFNATFGLLSLIERASVRDEYVDLLLIVTT